MRPTGLRAGRGSIALVAGGTDRGMRELRHSRTRNHVTRVARWFTVGAAGMLVATAASASPARSSGAARFASVRPTAGAPRGTALASDAAAPSRPCAGSGGACESTNPTFTLQILAVGDSSACTYGTTIDWGDGNTTHGSLQGGPDGARLTVGSHTFQSPGTYTISMSMTPTSAGVCGPGFSVVTTFTWQRAADPDAGGQPNASQVAQRCDVLHPVNAATGVLWETQTDAAVPGHGVPLELTRTYSASDASKTGSFGHGWTSSYGMSLSLDATTAVVRQENGAPATFYNAGTSFLPGTGLLGSLVANGNGTYTFTRDATNVAYVFSAAGRLIAVTDRNGYTTTLTYDGGGDLTQVRDPAGRSLTLAHAGGHIVSATDPAGHKTSYGYDAAGDLTSVADPMGRTRKFTYDADHLLLSATDPNGGTSTNTYDDAARVTKQVDAAGRATTLTYAGDPASEAGATTTMIDARGIETQYRFQFLELTETTTGVGTADSATTTFDHDPDTLACSKITDPLGAVTTRTFDARGDLLSTTDPLGHERAYTYNAQGDRLTATDAQGTTTTSTYDARGNLLSTSTPLTGGGAATWTYTYGSGAAAGDRLAATDPNGHTATYAYDAAGDRTSATDPLGHTTTASYDGLGRRTASTTPLGHRTTYAYDADGELTKLVDPRGGVTTLAYDQNGNRIATTDANGHKTTVKYDALDRPTAVIAPDGTASSSSYDANGNVTEQKDGNGHATRYAYDPLDRVISSTDAKGRKTRYGYDKAGNRTSQTSADGKTTTFAYDADDRNTGVSYSDGETPAVHQTFDANDRRTSLTDGTGTSTFSRDTLGRLVGSTNGAGASVAYAYDAAGNQTGITYPNGKTITRAFDAANRLTSVSDWLGHANTFSYDADDNQTGRGLPGNVTQTSSFDANGAVTEIADTRGGTALARFSYTRSPTEQVTSDTTAGAITAVHHYTYDSRARLASADADVFGYDAAGNPTTYVDGLTQKFDEADQLASSALSPTSTTPEPPAPSPQPPAPAPTPPGTRAPTQHLLRSAHAIKRRSLVATRITTSAPGELLLALVSLGGRSNAKPSVKGLRTKGLIWRRVTTRRAKGGLVGIWQARAAARLRKATVTVKLTKTAATGTLSLAAYGPGSLVHASGNVAGSKNAPKLTLRGAPGAIALAVGSATKAGRHRPAAGTRVVSQQRAGSAWLETTTTPSTGASIRIGDRSRLPGRWLLAGVVLAAPAAGAAASAARRATPSLSDRAAAPRTQSRTFTYDAEGDRTKASSAGSTVSFGYDQAHRLTSISGGISYRYDGDGLRASKTVAGTTTKFAWDDSGDLPLLLEADGTSYLYGPRGEPLEQITGDEPTYLLGDQQDSTRLLTDDSGAVVGTYGYDAWGNRASHSGATTDLQYDGQHTDAESGLIYLRARYYDPATGQFMSRDPLLAQTRSPYRYAADNPLNEDDPTGKAGPLITTGLVVLGIGGIWAITHPHEVVAFCRAALDQQKCYRGPDALNVNWIDICIGSPLWNEAAYWRYVNALSK
jgi:RHS repeat-associated protein